MDLLFCSVSKGHPPIPFPVHALLLGLAVLDLEGKIDLAESFRQ